MKGIVEWFLDWLKRGKEYLGVLFRWLCISICIGAVCGVIGASFHIGVHYATELRVEHPWLLWCLPVLGLGIVAFYKLTKTEGLGTNDIIDAVHKGKKLPIFLLPAIFIGAVLTHLGGGSAGREGAALQMGGTIGQHTGRLFRLDERDLRTATLAGMAAFFSALFGTPLAATMFALMVISVGITYQAAFIPCMTAALTAFFVAMAMGVEPTRLAVTFPATEAGMLVRVMVFSILCALVSDLFCGVIHFAEHKMKHCFPNAWVRVVVGGVAVVALTYLCGTTDYNGAGMEVIAAAVEEGSVRPEAFLLKLLFTAITLAAGFKGGEVVPSFFVGAAFGCLVGPVLGIPAGFAAALGLVAVFCGATNCPIASIFLAIEMYGDGGLLYYALACGISYMLSAYTGLYSSQMILHSKLKTQNINVYTNSYQAGLPENVPLEEYDMAQ